MSEYQEARRSTEEHEPITEEWLAGAGFRWHQFDRQPGKHWLLWIGAASDTERLFASSEDLGIELAITSLRPDETLWHCWLRSDGAAWNPENNLYGAMRSPRHAQHLREESQRLDRKLMLEQHPRAKWGDAERDDTMGGALPEHLEAHLQARKAKTEKR